MDAPSVPTLYHTRWCPSSIPLNVVKELDLPETKFRVKTITEDEMRHGEEFVKVSPRRMNPVLLMADGSTLLETGAITLYLLERFDKDGKLHPLVWDERRPKFLQGMFYAATDSFSTMFEMFRLTKMEKERDEKKIEEVRKKLVELVVDHLERELKCGQQDYYLGSEYSAVDMMFAYLLMCLEYCAMDFGSMVVQAYHERLQAKEAYKFTYTPTEEEKKKNEAEECARQSGKTGAGKEAVTAHNGAQQ